MEMTIYSNNGKRKYLTRSETELFLKYASDREDEIHLFCWTIAATGCRISEALALTPQNIDEDSGYIVIECLKKRMKQVYRTVPVQRVLLQELGTYARRRAEERPLWPWSRMTGYRRVREVMEAAGIEGVHASPKGLRHGFGVTAIQAGVPLNLVQRWLGHADIKTTAIYTNASGPEERAIASKMWANGRDRSTQATDRRLGDRRRSPGLIGNADGIPPDPKTADPKGPIAQPKSLGKKPLFAKLKQISSCKPLQFWLFCNRLFSCFSYKYPASIDLDQQQRPRFDREALPPLLELSARINHRVASSVHALDLMNVGCPRPSRDGTITSQSRTPARDFGGKTGLPSFREGKIRTAIETRRVTASIED